MVKKQRQQWERNVCENERKKERERQRQQVWRIGWYNNVLACASIYLHNVHLKAVVVVAVVLFLFLLANSQLMEKKSYISI